MKKMCCALSLVSIVALSAQNPPPASPPQTPPVVPAQQAPVFRSTVDLVYLDVAVLDRERRVVRGLAQSDFTILEDGKPQEVAAFAAVDVPDAADPPAKWMRDVAPDVRSNDMTDSRLFVIVLDDALIPADAAMTKTAKDIVKQFVDKLGPTDLAAIVLTADNRNTQDFTNDHERLLAVLDKFQPGSARYTFGTDAVAAGIKGAPTGDEYFFESAIDTLRNVADYLSAVPQHKKALIWVSPGIPVDFEQVGPVMISGGVDGSGMGAREAQLRLIDELPEVFKRAQRANVAIHTFDPSGPGGMERYIMSQIAARAGATAMDIAHKQATLQLDSAQMISKNTGGHATVNTTDYAPAIAQVFRENSSYYLLGFQPTNIKQDGKYRRTEVKVNRPGLDVRVRTGYYAPEAVKVTETAKAASASPLATAMASLLPHPDMPMQVTVVPFAYIPEPVAPAAKDAKDAKDKNKKEKPKEKNTATVAIVLGAKQQARDESATARIVEDVELLVSAFTPEGTARGSARQTAHIALKQGVSGLFGYEIVTKIDLAPGRYELRLATYSAALEKTGSVFTDVVVPDFTQAPLALSGVVINRTPAIPSGPKEALKWMLPFQPTSDRDFHVADVVKTFMRIYQGGKGKVAPVTMGVRVTSSEDKAVVEQTDTIDIAKFSDTTRAADYQFLLEVAKLPPGQYVVTFTATLGKDTAKRDVRFTVR